MVPAASALLALRSQGKPIPAAALTTAGFTASVQCWSFKEFTLWEAIEMAAAAGAGAGVAAVQYSAWKSAGVGRGESKSSQGSGG